MHFGSQERGLPSSTAFSPRAAVHDSLQPKNFLQPNSYKDSRFIAILCFLDGPSSSLQLLRRVHKSWPSFPTLPPPPRDSANPRTPSQWEPAPVRSRSSRASADPCAALIAWGCRAEMRARLGTGGICLIIFQLAVWGDTALGAGPAPLQPPPPPAAAPGSSVGLGRHPPYPETKPTFQW